jgi:hypothetical protein
MLASESIQKRVTSGFRGRAPAAPQQRNETMIINMIVTYLSVEQIPHLPSQADTDARPQKWWKRWL